MVDRIAAVVALIVLIGFLGILVWKLQRIDLFVVVALTVILAGWDALGRS